MTQDQLEAFIDFIKNEAQYAADDIMNRNDCYESLRRMRLEKELREAFLGPE